MKTQNTTAANVMKAAWATYKANASRSHWPRDHGRAAFARVLKETWALFNKVNNAVCKIAGTTDKGETIIIANARDGKGWFYLHNGYAIFHADVYSKPTGIEIYVGCKGKLNVQSDITEIVRLAGMSYDQERAIVQARATGKDVVIGSDFSRATAENDYAHQLLVATPTGEIKTVYNRSY